MLYLACLASALSLMIVVLPLGLPAQVVSMLGLLFLRGTCTECVRAGSGLEVYGRFAKDFDFELFRAAVGSDVPSRGEAHESFQQRPHCDAGASGRVVDVVAGKRHAMFPGGITQRAAPGFASTMSRLAASARSPGEVAASALSEQALQTGKVQTPAAFHFAVPLRLVFATGARPDYGVCGRPCGPFTLQRLLGFGLARIRCCFSKVPPMIPPPVSAAVARYLLWVPFCRRAARIKSAWRQFGRCCATRP